MKNNLMRTQTTRTSAILMAAIVITSGGCAKLFHMIHYNHLSGYVQKHHMAYYHSAHTGRIVSREYRKHCVVEPPCFGYEPTCWHRWPDECGRCPAEEVITDMPYSDVHSGGEATSSKTLALLEDGEPVLPAGTDLVEADLPDVIAPLEPEVDPIKDPEIPDLTLPGAVDIRPPKVSLTKSVSPRRSLPAPKTPPRPLPPKTRSPDVGQVDAKPTAVHTLVVRPVGNRLAVSKSVRRLRKAPLLLVEEQLQLTALLDRAVQELAEEVVEFSLDWDSKESVEIAAIELATVPPEPNDGPVAVLAERPHERAESEVLTAKAVRDSLTAETKDSSGFVVTSSNAVDSTTVSSRRHQTQSRLQSTNEAPVAVAGTVVPPPSTTKLEPVPTFKITPVLPVKTVIGTSSPRVPNGNELKLKSVVRFIASQQEPVGEPVTADAGVSAIRFR